MLTKFIQSEGESECLRIKWKFGLNLMVLKQKEWVFIHIHICQISWGLEMWGWLWSDKASKVQKTL